MVDALWDADYYSPADLRRTDPSAKSQLDLLEARVCEQHLGKDTIDKLLGVLGSTCREADLRRLSLDIDIPYGVWHRGGSIAELCNQFLAEVVHRDRLRELVEAIDIEYPNAIV